MLFAALTRTFAAQPSKQMRMAAAGPLKRVGALIRGGAGPAPAPAPAADALEASGM